jgi:hypothetical protein
MQPTCYALVRKQLIPLPEDALASLCAYALRQAWKM